MSRKRVISAVALVVGSGLALAGTYELARVSARWARNALAAGGSMTFPQEVDLGILEGDKEVETSFTIKNQGPGPVRLSDFTADCNCVGLFRQAPSGRAPLGPAVLIAGEELVVGARFAAPGGVDRAVTHRVTFTADPPAPEPPTVELRGTVRRPVYTVPESVSWRPLRPQQAAEQVIHLVDRRQPPERAPLTLVPDHDSVTVESVEEVKDTEERSRVASEGLVYRVKLKVRAGEEEVVSGNVRVLCGVEKATIHSIPFAAAVGLTARLTPSSVVFPRPRGAEAYSARVRLSSDSPCEFAVGPAPEGFLLEQAGNFLTVRCDPAALPEPGKHTLAIDAKGADGTTRRLTLTVFVNAPPPAGPEG